MSNNPHRLKLTTKLYECFTNFLWAYPVSGLGKNRQVDLEEELQGVLDAQFEDIYEAIDINSPSERRWPYAK